MGMRKFAMSVVAAAAMGLGVGAAQAVLVGSGGVNPLTFSWDYNTGTSHLTGNGSMTITGWNSNQLSVSITLTNTSLLGGNGGERLVSFGFGIDPNATSVGFNDPGDTTGMVGASFASGALPANVQGIEICAYGGTNCPGGSNGGIYGAGGTDTFTVLLNSTTGWGNSVNIDPIGFKYQTGYGSFEFPSSSSTSSTSSTSTSSGASGSAPEPLSTGLVGLGLGAMALVASRRRRTAQAVA